MNAMPCFTDSDANRFPYTDYDHAMVIEAHADYLMTDCRSFSHANVLNILYDLHDGDLLPKMMADIANWKGGPESAHTQMKKLHNLLADALHMAAARECEKNV